MKLDNETKPNEEILRDENERLKKRLKEEYGMEGYISSSELSPEVENTWLKSIEEFERNYKKEKEQARNSLPTN